MPLRTLAAATAALGLGVAPAGCATTADLAPPVELIAARPDGPALPGPVRAAVTRGRRTYLTACTHCHAPEAVTSVPRSRWPAVLDDMAERSGLGAAERADLDAYVAAVLDWADAGRPGAPGSARP